MKNKRGKVRREVAVGKKEKREVARTYRMSSGTRKGYRWGKDCS